MKTGTLLVVSGPSGVGKNTVLREFCLRHPEVRYSISATTRSPRAQEVHGKDYYFLTRQEFTKGIAEGRFLEWAEFCGNLYGTPRDFVEEHLAAGVDLVMDIEIQGALQVKERMPAAVLVFLLPPSLEELERRIQGRGTEDAKSISSRLQVAIGELQMVERYDYAVVNDDVAAAAEKLWSILTAAKARIRGNYRQVLAQFWEQVPF
ncbi:MAG TPA: guanylate kinase [Firmicutes bacterium]|nr:guanylate kinase [Bacillota bacterium]